MRKILPFLLVVWSVSSLKAQEKTASFNCYFKLNSAVWPQDSVARFSAWLKPLLEKEVTKVSLFAYTDTIGTVLKNNVLAGERLKSVENYLTENSIAIGESFVFGESYDLKGYKNNPSYRKVEVRVQYAEKSEGTGSVAEARMETFKKSTSPVNLNIQFVPGEDVYIGNSAMEVEYLYLYLSENTEKKAFIRGHVCCENDLLLSKLRAYAVYQDLIRKGISASRISFDGFGNTIPVSQEYDEVSRQLNRRVDVIFSE